ncbi:alpha-glucan family phosphorylase [Candidatus Bipolaricaulota bacterium]|nr:alpha-glucan family phosphorylase [Candidatus Bipolaricaulota bacterium]
MSQDQPSVAYFCMEYGLASEMRIYAGGLGILAGDILKAANDCNYPLIGVGILWRQGYTEQVIDEDGRPVDCYPRNDYIYEYLEDTDVEITVEVREEEVSCKVWKLEKYDNSPLYLLDTNLKKNKQKWITGQLYGWFEEERVAQEIVLGIGGIRALRELGIEPDLYHFNEGHAVLAGTEMIREKMEEGSGFKEALDSTKDRIVFTTHTPVEQGNEVHTHRILQYMGGYNGLDREQMTRIGGSPFNMTAAGLRLSKVANGVSQLHGETARDMWKDVEGRSEIKAITNGIHQKTWVDPAIVRVKDDKAKLWEEHQRLKGDLIDHVNRETGVQFDEDKLLVGFARRAVPYKRADLIFTQEERIKPYLEDGSLQVVFSGKAHPLDDEGKGIITKLVRKAEDYPGAVAFLPDYRMETGKLLTQGSDVWLNNPKKPMEASGTSGMKAAMNGVLNLSVLDGWWPEACQHGVNGWQIGDGYTGENQDEHDANALYDGLINRVIPRYYEDESKWRDMMAESVKSTYGRFSARNLIENYRRELYTY